MFLRPRRLRLAPVLTVLWVGASACGLVEYEERPIDVDALLQEVEAARAEVATASRGEPLSLDVLEALAVERDPEVRERVAAFEASLALDRVRARLQDPTLSVAISGAVGPDVDRRPVAPSASLSVPVPLSQRLSREDARDLAQVELEAARVDAAARSALLDVRSAYLEAAMAAEREESRAEIAATISGMARTAEALTRSGAASGLDLALLRLEAARAEQARFQASVDREAAVAELARVLVVDPRTLDGAAFAVTAPGWLQDPSDFDAAGLRATRTDLAAIRREHELAEAQLALEIARQIQDLSISPSIGPQPAETFTLIGVALSGALPIFRRNVQAIAIAGAERARIETRFGIALDRARADLEQALAAIDRATRKQAFLEEQTLPVAEAVVETADRAVRAGTASGLAFLGATRTRAQIRFQEVSARQEVLRAWLAVERATQAPLLEGGARTVEDWPSPERLRRWRDERAGHGEQTGNGEQTGHGEQEEQR